MDEGAAGDLLEVPVEVVEVHEGVSEGEGQEPEAVQLPEKGLEGCAAVLVTHSRPL